MDTKPKHFYQKFPTWVAVSFLTGATTMVAAVALMSQDLGTNGGLALNSNSNGNRNSSRPTSRSASADAEMQNAPVQVFIKSPTPGEALEAEGLVQVSASAASAAGVRDMAIWIDDLLVKSCDGDECATVLPVSGLPARASHSIEVKARDNNGSLGGSTSYFTAVE